MRRRDRIFHRLHFLDQQLFQPEPRSLLSLCLRQCKRDRLLLPLVQRVGRPRHGVLPRLSRRRMRSTPITDKRGSRFRASGRQPHVGEHIQPSCAAACS
ncbi:unnamed protein product [Coccothraustes coccothraustes]